MRCIVSSLTDDPESELFSELQRGGGRIREQAEMTADSDYDHAHAAAAGAGAAAGAAREGHLWMPDPIESDPTKTAQSRQSDLISMLVNIYGSKEVRVRSHVTRCATLAHAVHVGSPFLCAVCIVCACLVCLVLFGVRRCL